MQHIGSAEEPVVVEQFTNRNHLEIRIGQPAGPVGERVLEALGQRVHEHRMGGVRHIQRRRADMAAHLLGVLLQNAQRLQDRDAAGRRQWHADEGERAE